MNILVTGSSSGIGETVARRFVHAGHQVILMARRNDLLVKIVDELNSGGQSNAVVADGDVGVWNDCLRVVETGIAAFGHIDGLVNAAGGWVDDRLDEASATAIDRFIRTDVTGATYITRAILPELRRNRDGRIVHINGLQGLIRQRPPVLYTMVESAVRGLCESLRWEAAAYGVQVGLITLGGVANTESDDPDPSVLKNKERGALLSRGEVADAIMYMMSRPKGVNIDEMVLTPLEQKF